MQRFIDSKGSRLAALSFVGLFCASFASSGSTEDAANVDRYLEISINAPAIASRGEGVVTAADLDAYLSRIPEDDLEMFLFSRRRIQEAIENLMLPRLVAEEARSEGFLKNDLLQAKLYQSSVVLIAQEYLDHHSRASELEDYSAQARELFLTRSDLFRAPRRVDFTHILVAVGAERGELEAMDRVQVLFDQLGDGVPLAELVSDYSDDPSKEDNQGEFVEVPVDQVEEGLVSALSLLEPGQISEPVRTESGWHIVQLNARHDREQIDWEQAEGRARDLARQRHKEAVRERLVGKLKEPSMQLYPEALADYLQRFGIDWAGFEQEPD